MNKKRANLRGDPVTHLPNLLEKALGVGGSSQVKEELWRVMRLAVHKYAVIVCRNKKVSLDVVEDIVQNSLISIIRQPDEKLFQVENWRAWLFRVVENKVNDYLRYIARKGIDKEISIHTPVGDSEDNTGIRELLDMLRNDDCGPEEKIIKKDLLKKIFIEISKLSKERQEVFRLYLNGYSQKEIVQKTGLTQAQVNIWIYRIKLMVISTVNNPDNGGVTI